MNNQQNNRGKIITVSAPSGTGKTTIVRKVLEEMPELVFSISATTRKRRENEIDGRDYFFLTEEEFRTKISNDEFAEWGKFYDSYYGTFRKFIEDVVNTGKSVLLEIDTKGALQIKKMLPESILIFILPPSIEELVTRLKNRNTESEEQLQKRIERAKLELSMKDNFDYFVENRELDTATAQIKSLIEKITGVK